MAEINSGGSSKRHARADSDPAQVMEWVSAALEGDPSAFSSLVQRFQRLGASVAFGVLGDSHLAADVVQEAFVKAYQALHRLQDAGRFVPWFLAIVRSTATDYARRRVRWGHREISVGDRMEVENSGGSFDRSQSRQEKSRQESEAPDQQLLQQEESMRIRSALLRLPEEYREVLLLKHLEGYSYREMAKMLGTTVRAIESRLFRARQQLQKSLELLPVEESQSGESPPGES